ncbi:MAG: hypothetical protein ACYCOU_04260 [Sulfobacillus sp.]
MGFNQAGNPNTQSQGTINPTGFQEIPQNYQTKDVVNTKTALYSLTIRGAAPSYPNIMRYIFPISPSEMHQSYTEMSSVYDVSGDSNNFGVSRIVDQYGTSPITFTIEGTTGWKYHSADGFNLTGAQSAATIRKLFTLFSKNNVHRMNSGLDPYTMEFYDYFQGQFWEVAPIGEVTLRQTSAKPLLFYYHIKLAGIRSLNGPPAAKQKPNVIDNMFSAASTTVANTVSAFASQVTGTYQEITGAL